MYHSMLFLYQKELMLLDIFTRVLNVFIKLKFLKFALQVKRIRCALLADRGTATQPVCVGQAELLPSNSHFCLSRGCFAPLL